jgi:hypothetical protein
MALFSFERGRKGVGVVDAEQEFGGPRKRRNAELQLGIFRVPGQMILSCSTRKRKDRRIV